MKLVILAIRDERVGEFMTPFFMQSEGQALRQFSDEVNRTADDNILSKHPEDFELYVLGSYEGEGAVFTLEALPRSLARGSSVKMRVN